MRELLKDSFEAVGRGRVEERVAVYGGLLGYVEFEESETGVWINYIEVLPVARKQGVATKLLEYLYKKGKLMHRGHLLTPGQCLAKVHARLREKYPLTVPPFV